MKKSIVFYGIKSFPSKGGTDRVAENLIIQLKDKFDITLYCFKDPLADDYISGVKIVQFTPWVKGALGSFLYFFLSAVHLLFEKKVDLVHAHKTDTAFFFPLLRIRFKVVATSHEAPYKRDKWNRFAKFYFQVVELMFIRFSSISTCISEPLTNYYKGKYGREVKFIPNGINMVHPAGYNFALAKSFLPQGAFWGEPFILFSARRLMATKGCHTLLIACKKNNFKGQVFIAGELHKNDPYLNYLKELASGMNVHFLGFVNPLPALLALIEKSLFFVFPSETEGMSIMLLETATVGKPIIASDIPENKQVFNETEVLFFKSKNANDLAEKLNYALMNPNEMENFGLNCQGRVFSDYLWLNIAESYAAVYNQVLGQKLRVE